MVDDVSLIIIKESISIVIEGDVVHDFCHRGVIDFDSDDADELSSMINGDAVGNHPGIQILRNVWRQPYAFTGCFRNGEPNQ